MQSRGSARDWGLERVWGVFCNACVSHAAAYTVRQLQASWGLRGHPTGIKKAPFKGRISQWAAEPRGAALLITARAVCQHRHMMHGAITIERNTKEKFTTTNKSAASPWEQDNLYITDSYGLSVSSHFAVLSAFVVHSRWDKNNGKGACLTCYSQSQESIDICRKVLLGCLLIVFGRWLPDLKCHHLTRERSRVSATLMTANKEHMVLAGAWVVEVSAQLFQGT